MVLREGAPAAAEWVKAAMAEGLLVVPAGPSVLRFVPPLVIQPRQVKEALRRLEAALLRLPKPDSSPS